MPEPNDDILLKFFGHKIKQILFEKEKIKPAVQNVYIIKYYVIPVNFVTWM